MIDSTVANARRFSATTLPQSAGGGAIASAEGARPVALETVIGRLSAQGRKDPRAEVARLMGAPTAPVLRAPAPGAGSGMGTAAAEEAAAAQKTAEAAKAAADVSAAAAAEAEKAANEMAAATAKADAAQSAADAAKAAADNAANEAAVAEKSATASAAAAAEAESAAAAAAREADDAAIAAKAAMGTDGQAAAAANADAAAKIAADAAAVAKTAQAKAAEDAAAAKVAGASARTAASAAETAVALAAKAKSDANAASQRAAAAQTKADAAAAKLEVAQAAADAAAAVKAAGEAVRRGADQAAEYEGLAALSYWMAKLQKTVSDCSDQQLLDAMERFKAQNKSQRESYEKQAAEAQKKEEAAAKASSAMGCASKILGGLIVAVSLVSAVFTGGSSLALAAVGLALFAADIATEAATGKSLTERALSPLMDAVVSPLMNAIGGAIAGVLQKFGMDKDLAQIIGAAVGAVLAVVAVVAIAVVAKSGQAAKLGSKLAGPLMRALSKAVPQLLKAAMSKLGGIGSSVLGKSNQLSKFLRNAASRLGGKLGVNADSNVLALQAQRIQQVMVLLNGSANAGTSTWLGFNEKAISEIEAEIIELMNEMSRSHQVIDTAVGQWQAQQEWETAQTTKLSDAVEREQQAVHFIIGGSRRMMAF